MELTLKEKQKQEALERMKMLNIMGKVRNDFRTSNKIYYSERQSAFFNAILYWLDNKKEFVKIVRDFEAKTGGMVYHAQLTHTIDGDLLSLFYVSKNEKEWDMDKDDIQNECAFVYCANVGEDGNELFYDYGTIGIKSSMGGITRTY